MLRNQTIMLREQIWQIQREPAWQNQEGGWHEAQSWALFCPGCHKIWAWTVFEGDSLIYPGTAFCEECPSNEPELVSGSLFLWHGCIDAALLAALPEPLLRREFMLHLKQLDKELENGTQA
jgi:hypothetical protein